MKDRTTSVIALYGRGRELAYAVFERGDLVRFGIKTIRGRRSGSTFEKTIRRAVAAILLQADKPLVVVERADDRHRPGALSRALPCIASSIVAPSRIRTVRLSDAKQRFCGDPHATHRQLIASVEERFPVLRRGERKLPTFGLPEGSAEVLAVALAETFQRRAAWGADLPPCRPEEP